MPKKIRGIIKETDKGKEVRCPNCGEWQLVEKYRSFTLNPHYVAELTPVLQCLKEVIEEKRVCMHIFAPTVLAHEMRVAMLAGVETKE